MLLTLPQKLSKRTTSVPIRHSIPTVLVPPVSVIFILNPNFTCSLSIGSWPFLRADRDHTLPVTAPMHLLSSHIYCVSCIEVKNRWIRGIVNELDNGALIWYCGVFGRNNRSAYAEGHETSYRQLPKSLCLLLEVDREGTTMLGPTVSSVLAQIPSKHNFQSMLTKVFEELYLISFQLLHQCGDTRKFPQHGWVPSYSIS